MNISKEPIWTRHALEQLAQRKMKRSEAELTYNKPDKITPGKKPHTQEYTKRIDSRLITLITIRTDAGESLVISTWQDPPVNGTQDEHKQKRYHQWHREFHRSGWFGKLWLLVKKQILGY